MKCQNLFLEEKIYVFQCHLLKILPKVQSSKGNEYIEGYNFHDFLLA